MKEKYIFTYGDYLTLKQGSYFGIQENKSKDKVFQKYDKSFKQALSEPKEMSNFLKEFINLEIDENQIEKYKTEYITKNYKIKESDMIYKNKKEEIYYIVEQQTRVDKNMIYRMLNYCMELMRDRVENSKVEIYPTIVPIVLYTGRRKWTAEKEFRNKQIYSKGKYQEYKIDFKYKLVDINKYSKEQLLMKQIHIANMMLIEKSENKEETLENIKMIIENTKDIHTLIKLRKYIVFIQEEVLKEKEEEILNMIEEKMGDDMMSTLIERLRKENEAIRKQVREETKKELKEKAREEANKKIEEARKEIREQIRKQVREETKKELKEKAREEANKKIEEARKEIREQIRKQVREETKKELKESELKELLKTVVNMLKYGESEEKIKLYTNATDEQIEQGRKQLRTSS